MIQPAATVSFTMQDETGSVSILRLFLRATTSPIAAMAAAIGLIDELGGISTAVVRRIGISYASGELPQSRNPAGDNRQAGIFIWRAGAGEAYFLTSIPAIRPNLLHIDGDGAGFLINQDAPEIQAFNAAVCDGIFVNPLGDDVIQLSEAFLQVT